MRDSAEKHQMVGLQYWVENIITFLQKGRYLELDRICQIFETNFIQYLCLYEEIIIEHTLELFNILLNDDKLTEYYQMQNSIIVKINELVTEIPNTSNYISQLRNGSRTSQFLLLQSRTDLDHGYDTRFAANHQIYPFLQLLDYLIRKTQDYQCLQIVKKCLQLNQKRARLQAIIILNSNEMSICQEDILEILEITLNDLYLDVRAQAIELSIKRASRLRIEKNDDKINQFIQQLGVFFLVNQQLDNIKADILKLFEILSVGEEQVNQIIQSNFFIMVNVSAIQITSYFQQCRKQAWHTLSLIVKDNSDYIGIYGQLLQMAIIALEKETENIVVYYCLQFVKKLIKIHPEILQKYQENTIQLVLCLIKIEPKRNQTIINDIIDIITCKLLEQDKNNQILDMAEKSLQYLINSPKKQEICQQILKKLLIERNDICLNQFDKQQLEKLLDQEGIVINLKNQIQIDYVISKLGNSFIDKLK